MKKLILLAIVTLVSCITIAQAEIPAAKREEIEKMLRLTGMEKLMTQMMAQMITGMKTRMPEVPEVFWSKFQSKIDTSELIEKIIPLYDKYYTLDDLKAVNAFYQSPAGQRILSVSPQIMQESMKIGQEWGMKIGEQAANEAQQTINNSGHPQP